MAAPHQNIADILVLKTAANDPDANLLNRDACDRGMPDLDTDAPVGLKLAAARKAKGLSHLEIHAGTKIKIVHIVAIEAGERAFLPATPFTAGFVKAYAQFLGLNGDEFARAYKREAGFVPLAAQLPTPTPAPAPRPTPAQGLTAPAAPQPPLASSPQSEPAAPEGAPAPLRQSIDADKMVTWVGAGAVIAIAAFLAGRAAQPGETASRTAPPASVISQVQPIAAPAPTQAAAPETPLQPPIAAEPIATTPAIAAVAPPVIKPKPKKPAIVEAYPPAPVEVTPAPVMIAPPIALPEPAPAEPPAPTIVAAKILRGALPLYPERCALRAGRTVGVSVIFSITPAGKPVSASVASSENRCFNPAALRTVYDMRFAPRTIDGAPAIETGKTVTVQFVR